ncbi:hypothetical protein [Nostoc sp. UHCC 0252]|nr:hypothetical protein [Nostoc sp. UHCC 0252]MEA5601580.1 hypothetical protein [Nostoc sp. UHCC 0252]
MPINGFSRECGTCPIVKIFLAASKAVSADSKSAIAPMLSRRLS